MIAKFRHSQDASTKRLFWFLVFICASFVAFWLYLSDTFIGQLFEFNRNSNILFSFVRKFDQSPNKSIEYTSKLPVIIFWTDYSANDASWFYEIHPDCPYKCFITANRSYVRDAVIRILDVEEPQSEYPPDNPKAYNARRLFESPVVANNISSFHPDYFNITISYRSTATVYQPYNGAIKRDGTEKADEIWTVEQVKNAVEKKTKKVLAIITNCKVVQSARREYVEELSKHINVTKIGSCFGNRKSFEELKILLDEHHFVLAFENSICPEYTTEKYWRFNDLVVPVVMSRGVLNWDNVINGTFIVASDFKAPSALAEHLNSLINDKSKYMKYFEWTKTYRKNLLGTQWPAASRSNAGCQLCRIATLKPRLPPINMQEHWNVKECASDFGHYLINDTKTVKIMETQMAELVQRTAKKRSAYGKLDDL